MSVPIPSFGEWLQREPGRATATWLVLGKGPSFARLGELDADGTTRDMLRFGLNHVVRETRVDVFHCIDIEVIEHCGEAILANCRVAVLPWAPHVRRRLVPFSSYREFLPSGLSLAEYAARSPVLRILAAEQRLCWYNLRTAPRRLRRPGAPVTPVRGFSASAAVHLLADAGVRRIRTLGIDGGKTYARGFSDLSGKTLLAASQSSFDSQFASIASAIGRYGLDLAPLDCPGPLRVRIIAGTAEQLQAKVLVYALERRASLSLRCTLTEHGDTTAHDALALPASCLLLDDVRRLAPGARPDPTDLERQGRAWYWPPGKPSPWRHADAAGGRTWCAELLNAVEDGHIGRAEVARAVGTGEVRPSLLSQIDRRIAEPLLLPRRALARDDAPPGAGLASRARALLRELAIRVCESRWRRYGGIVIEKLPRIIAGLGR